MLRRRITSAMRDYSSWHPGRLSPETSAWLASCGLQTTSGTARTRPARRARPHYNGRSATEERRERQKLCGGSSANQPSGGTSRQCPVDVRTRRAPKPLTDVIAGGTAPVRPLDDFMGRYAAHGGTTDPGAPVTSVCEETDISVSTATSRRSSC